MNMITLQSKQMGPRPGSSKRRRFHSNKHFPYQNRGSKVNKASAEEVTKNKKKNLKAGGRTK